MASKKTPTTEGAEAASVIRIKPQHYIHILDHNTNLTRVERGPKTFIRQDHEEVVQAPVKMITVPMRQYCMIGNPVKLDAKGQPLVDGNGQYELRWGDTEVRGGLDEGLEPFPLYPGETMVGDVSPVLVVNAHNAIRLRATRDFEDTDQKNKKVTRPAGSEWLFEGPATYVPRVQATIVATIVAKILKPNEGLKLRARKETTDRKGKPRRAGEEWLHREEGAYLPGVDEEILEVLKARTLTRKKALHLRAVRSFIDVYGLPRQAGDEWLIDDARTPTHIPDVYEQVVKEVDITTLTNREYCFIINPVVDGKPQYGTRKLVKGEKSFFLQPFEKLEPPGVQQVHVLQPEEAMLLRARFQYVEKGKTADKDKIYPPGARWMIYGPREYIPPVEVEIVQRRRTIPLDENEGIYVRNVETGEVRAVSGVAYMLEPSEELWEKDLPTVVEELLAKDLDPYGDRGVAGAAKKGANKSRDKTRMVTFRVPHNAAVQVYDFRDRSSRVVFGPELVMLGPEEQFTVLNLSGGKPKQPNLIKSLALLMGPDFMTDIVKVETSDHARLQLQLSYNWHFKVDPNSKEQAALLFQVPDFVGDACKAIASLVRGAVANVPFDVFHKTSAKVIRAAVFGKDESGKIKDEFVFKSNNLVITNIDMQGSEPVDSRARDALQKTIQLAIAISTESQEAEARHDAERTEAEVKGKLDIQKILSQAENEKARTRLLTLQAQTTSVEASGRAEAEAKARARGQKIQGEAAVEQAVLKAQAVAIAANATLEQKNKARTAEVTHLTALNTLELDKATKLASIESAKFQKLVGAVGPDTIAAISQADPIMQQKLLTALGLSGFLISGGNSPITMFGGSFGSGLSQATGQARVLDDDVGSNY
jgi:major vault protein